jgi:hypothetical protein
VVAILDAAARAFLGTAMMTGIKYSLLLLPTHFDYETGVRQLMPDMISWRGKLSDLIDASQVSHWKQWLGDIDWRYFDEEQRLVLVSMPSARAAIHDDETELLRGRLGLAAYAMLLAAPTRPYSGIARCVHGEALSVKPPVRLETIRGQFDVEEIQRPYYDSRPAFGERFVQIPRLLRDPYLDRWAALVPVLEQFRSANPPRILEIAFQAFNVALTRSSLEFAIPEFVRAVECIIGLSRGMGRKDFAHRSMLLANRLRKHWYVGGKGLQSRARSLYGHRSDCVHGKVPFETLLSGGEAGKDEAARFAYLAEALARECLLWVLENPQHYSHFTDRAALEAAWNAGAIKSEAALRATAHSFVR